MSRPRGQSETSKVPHSLSLKVLRLSLSKPSLSFQYPSYKQHDDLQFKLDSRATLSYPPYSKDDQFTLSPLLQLPSSFGSAYVGETFQCAICANNELAASSTSRTTLSAIRLAVEMQTPGRSDATGLDLLSEGSSEDPVLVPAEDIVIDLAAGASLQRVVRFDLREPGAHTLAVTVTYTETHAEAQGLAARGKVRTFRKLYQFQALQLLGVRTKIRLLPDNCHLREPARQERLGTQWALEAQLENQGDKPLYLAAVALLPAKGIGKTLDLSSIDVSPADRDSLVSSLHDSKPMLGPGEVTQVAFIVCEAGKGEAEQADGHKDGRVVLGQMVIRWRGQMGEKGELSSSWLAGQRT